jgi:hypothetical protein
MRETAMARKDEEAASKLLSRHERHRRSLRQRDERRERAWGRDDFLVDRRKATRITEDIRSEPGEADKLNAARRHAREGKLISLDELKRELDADDE